MRANAGEGARGSLFWRYCPSPMSCHNRGDGFNQNNPPNAIGHPDKGALFFVRKFLSPRNTQNRCGILILSNHNVRFGVCSHAARTLADAIDLEPVSASPANGKLTGNFAKFACLV